MFYFMAGPTAPFTEVVCGTCLIYFYVRIFKKRRRMFLHMYMFVCAEVFGFVYI